MLSIIKKLSPIVVDAFTYDQNFLDYYAPTLATTYKSFDSSLVKNSFILSTWCDTAINAANVEGTCGISWKFSDNASRGEIHQYFQFQGFVTEKKLQQFKLCVPWKLREKTGIKFVCAQPFWALKELNNNFSVMPGIIDLKYQESVNIQLLLNYPQVHHNNAIFIPANTPLCQMYPLSDRPVRIKTHLVDERNFYTYSDKFSNHYLYRKKLTDKCPFH